MRRDRGWRDVRLVAFAILSQWAVSSVQANAGDVAIIVNKANAINGISSSELAKLLKQDRQHWADGRRVYLILREAGSTEKKIMLRKVYKTNEIDLKRFLVAKLYRGDITSLPKTLSSNEAVKRFVSQVPTAIGFIDAAMAGPETKILRVDGKLPGEPEYLLSE